MSTFKLLTEAQFHGANRLTDRRKRWFWILALLSLVGVALMLITTNILRFYADPTHMVKFDTIESVTPFPAVIVCPEIAFSEEKIDQFFNEIKTPAGMQTDILKQNIKQISAYYSPDVHYNVSDLMELQQFLEYNDLDVEEAAVRMTASCEETLIRCRWNGEMVNCMDLFQMELTGDGFCCVFNGRSMRRELRERDSRHLKSKVWLNTKFGYTSGIMLVVNQSQTPANIDLTYKWVALLNNQQFVDSTINGTALSPGTEQWLASFKRNFEIDDGARVLSANLRKCNLATETSILKYFPIYEKKYCSLECEITKTYERCKCLRLVHPYIKGRPYCSAKDLECSFQSMVSVASDACNCPSTCDFDFQYEQTFSFDLDPLIKPLDHFYHDLDYDKVTIVRIYVARRLKASRKRWSYYSYLDLFSQVGGTLNLFIGTSVLTMLALLQVLCRAIVTPWTTNTIL